jgi:hypothetical protein
MAGFDCAGDPWTGTLSSFMDNTFIASPFAYEFFFMEPSQQDLSLVRSSAKPFNVRETYLALSSCQERDCVERLFVNIDQSRVRRSNYTTKAFLAQDQRRSEDKPPLVAYTWRSNSRR